MGIDAGSLHLTTILQAGNCNLTTYKYQYTNCDNATHVVKPKHQHLLVQYYGFASRLEERDAVRIWALMQVRSISLPCFKQPIATKQPDSIQTETMQPMWCNPNISTYLFNTTGLHEGWEQNINKLLHTATFTQQIIEFIQSEWLLLWFTVSVCLGCALWSACTRCNAQYNMGQYTTRIVQHIMKSKASIAGRKIL